MIFLQPVRTQLFPEAAAMRACISRVRCGTIPTIRSMSISWPLWCISCSLTERIISKWLFDEGVIPARISTRSPRKLSNKLSAAVALLGDVETLTANVGDFGGGEASCRHP